MTGVGSLLRSSAVGAVRPLDSVAHVGFNRRLPRAGLVIRRCSRREHYYSVYPLACD